MSRIIPMAFVMLVTFVAVLVLSRVAATAGLVPDDAVTLWASAITASFRAHRSGGCSPSFSVQAKMTKNPRFKPAGPATRTSG